MEERQSDSAYYDTEEELENEPFTPRGTLLFVMLMLTGYALYWAFLWFLVVIVRG